MTSQEGTTDPELAFWQKAGGLSITAEIIRRVWSAISHYGYDKSNVPTWSDGTNSVTVTNVEGLGTVLEIRVPAPERRTQVRGMLKAAGFVVMPYQGNRLLIQLP